LINYANETNCGQKNKEIEISEPHVVKLHDVKLDTEYAVWIGEVKHRYHSVQLNTVVNMNGEKLLSNWQMGRDRVQKKAEEHWSACIVEQVSLDSKRVFPNEDDISTSNLWYMKKWRLFYTNHASSEILQRPIGE